MIKRIVEISQARTYLSVRNGQLLIERKDEVEKQAEIKPARRLRYEEPAEVKSAGRGGAGGEREVAGGTSAVREGWQARRLRSEGPTRVPCEDVGILLVDHAGTVYTHSVFTELLKYGAAVVLCGRDHHPTGMFLPVEGNSVQTERMRQQAAAKEPLKKQIWKQIIQAKIRHQAKVLGPECGAYDFLLELAHRVKSGDKGNIESQASRRYWPDYLADFRRRREGLPPNNMLNYGYMVVRAAVARSLCGAGLLVSSGVHHRNKYNAFCLADDVMEPFRGFVERKVRDIMEESDGDGPGELDQATKAQLLEVLYETITIGGQKGPLMVGLHRTAASLVKCFAGENKKIELPEL